MPPEEVNLGALMKTPGKSRPRASASMLDWNESAWVPKPFLSILASTRGSPPSPGSANRMAPAQVPSTGLSVSALIQSKTAGRREDTGSFPVSLMVVDSPPGITIAWGSEESRSDDFLNSCISISMPVSMEARSRAAICEWRAPWSITMPIRTTIRRQDNEK